MLRCYAEMLTQDAQFKELSKTVYTSQWGQSTDRDIGVSAPARPQALARAWLATRTAGLLLGASTHSVKNAHRERRGMIFCRPCSSVPP
jgi:hypothetical protein